jgi:hypothetical protein
MTSGRINGHWPLEKWRHDAMMMMALNKRHDGCIKGTKSDRFIATPSCSVGACAVGGHIGGSRPFQPLVSSHSQFLWALRQDMACRITKRLSDPCAKVAFEAT